MMDREWFTASELAELALPTLPATPQNINARAKRESWQHRERQGRGGGREYHISSLPSAAKAKLVMDAGRPTKPARKIAKDALVRDEMWRWYDGCPDSKKAKAEKRLVVLDAVEMLYRNGVSKDVAVMTVARQHGVGVSSVYNWFKLVEGVPRSDWLPHLAPRHVGTTATTEVPDDAWDMIKSDYLRPERPRFEECYRRLQRAAKAQGWALPSSRTLQRRLNKEVHPAAIILARQGVEAVKRMFPAQERDRSVFHALEAINGDGHTWDIWVEWPDGEISRPCMTAFQDLYSGMVLAWRIAKTHNAGNVRLALGDVVEQFGIPDACWLDNGRDFASKWITGGIANRYRFKVRDEEPAGLLTQLGVEVHWTTPYSGQSKPIERAFRDFAGTIARHPEFSGAWTGNSPVNKPENYRSKAIPLERFEEVIASEIHEHNDRQGRQTRTAAGRSFRETFEESYARSPITKATEEQRRLWLLAAEGVTVNSRDGSIRLMDNRYWADFLHLHLGEKVAARFDPDFLHDGLHIYRMDGAYLGHAPVLDPAGFDNADQAREHGRARRAFLRATREMLEAEKRMSATQVAAMVPRNAGPATPSEGTVIQLARPTLDLKRTPKRQVSAETDARREALVLSMKQARAPEPKRDEKRERYARAVRIEEALASGGDIGEGEVEWLKRYRQTPEYRTQKRLAEDFAGYGQQA